MDVEVLKKLPADLWKKPVPISCLDELAYHMEEWEKLSPYINLSPSECEEIRRDYQGQYLLQKRAALRKWRKNDERSASWKSLISILCNEGQKSLAEEAAKISQRSPSCIKVFAKYLRRFYVENFSHPSCNQWSIILEDLDLPGYVDLKFLKVPLSETDKTLSAPVEIKLKDVFLKTGKRFVTLFEGIAGSGKTTFSWHACKEWANQRLLQDFDLLIHVQLNKEKFQSAQSLTDLITDPDKEACNEISQAIVDNKGKGVCLLLEALDEATESLQNFILSNLLMDRQLCNLSVIITSRPNSRCLIKLQKTLTSKISINGFSVEKLNEFLSQAVKGREEKHKVDEMFDVSTRFQTLCTLPINAVVVSFLVQFFGPELPTTQTGLFNLLICHLCIRHVQLRDESAELLRIEKLPEDLPSDLRESFNKLCLLAYNTLIEKKKVVSLKDLREVSFNEQNDNKLGILQVCLTKSMYGIDKSCSFPHFSLQQFLAAVHLSSQSNAKQASSVMKVLEHDPLDEILPFYAGLTNLSCVEVRNSLLKILDLCLNEETIVLELMKGLRASLANDPRRRALALFKCLYECQSESVIKEARLKEESKSQDPGIDVRYVISFHNMWLSPLDCLAISYFVRYKSISMRPRSSLSLVLEYCSISTTSVIILMRELRKDLNFHTPGRVILRLAANKLSSKVLLPMKAMLKGQSNIEGLGLQGCFQEICMKNVLKHLIEGLNCNSSCRQISIGFNGLDQSHIYHLVLLIMSCPQLPVLDLSGSSLSGVMPLLGKAISLSGLMNIFLSRCNIDDEALVCLAKEACHSGHLHGFHMFVNPEITPQGMANFVSYFANKVSTLSVVEVDPTSFGNYIESDDVLAELQRVTEHRKKYGLPELRIMYPSIERLPNIQGSNILSLLPHLSRKDNKN